MEDVKEVAKWLSELGAQHKFVAVDDGGMALIAFDKYQCYTGASFEIGSSPVRSHDSEGTPNDDDEREIWRAIRELDSDLYDVEAAITDLRNNNLDPHTDLEVYRYVVKVWSSWISGQFEQARECMSRHCSKLEAYRHAKEVAAGAADLDDFVEFLLSDG